MSFIFGWYAFDMDSFVERLCENKDRPQLQCNGKCYLSEMITENTKEDAPSPLILEWEPQVLYLLDDISASSLTEVFYVKHLFFYKARFTKGITHAVFHPPPYS